MNLIHSSFSAVKDFGQFGSSNKPSQQVNQQKAINVLKRQHKINMVTLNSRKGSTFCRAASSADWIAYGFHHALPACLTEDIERIQKRALFIISPAMSYREFLDSLGLPTLFDRRNRLCRQLFDSTAINSGHKLYHLQPPRKQSSYNLRRQKLYNLPRSHTERFLLFCLCYVPGLCIKLLKFQIRSQSTLL